MLATDGVLVFKWNETQVKVMEVLALACAALAAGLGPWSQLVGQ